MSFKDGNTQVQIAHLTTVHPRVDARIRIKEVGSLAEAFAEPIALFVQDGKGDTVEADGMVQVIDVGQPPGRRFVRMIVGTWRMWRVVWNIRPRVIHFHDPESIPLGVILKCFGFRVVYDVHEDLPRQVLTKYWLPTVIRRPVSWSMSAIEWLAAHVFDAIVPASPKVNERFPPDKTVLLRNYPVLSELTTTDGIPYKERPSYFAYIGGITTVRGIHEMISAIDIVNGKVGSDTRLCLAGAFQPTRLLSEVQTSPGWRQTDFSGWVNRTQVTRILNSVRAGLAVLHPTQNYPDAYPTKMFEYMSVGLPVIVSDFPLWRSIVEDAGCGLLVDPLDPQAIAGAMQWILDHPDEAEAMGRRGRAAVEKHYNWETEAEKLIALYNKLLPD